jgi:hypothetical protein
MLKPGKTFVLSKQTKRMMCSIVDTESRNQFKNMMIQAELAAAIVPKREKRPSGPQGNNGYTTNPTGTASTSN